jgi:hypothetical protein
MAYLFLLRRCRALRIARFRSMRRFSPLETYHLRFRSSPRMPLLATCFLKRLSRSSWDSPGLSCTLIYSVSPPLCRIPVELAEINTSPSRQSAGTKKNLGCYPTQTPRGQQPRSTTPQTIPCIGETISLSAPVKPHPMNDDNTSRGNCQVAGRQPDGRG